MTNAIEGAATDRLVAHEMRGHQGESRAASRSVPGKPSSFASLWAIVRGGARCLLRAIDRIVHGIRCVAPLALSFACQSTSELGAEVATQPAAAAKPARPAPPANDAPSESGPRQLGKFSITFYYVVGEDEIPAKPVMLASNDNGANGRASDAELTAISPAKVTLYGASCEPIADVSKEFANQLTIQGTGKLHDGRVLNIWGACNCKRSPCFKVTRAQWGTSGTGRALEPFRTVAVDPKVVKLGSLLYIPLLEGRTMPGRAPWGGYVHDGCVVADDTGGHIAGSRIDLFVGRKGYFNGLGRSGSQGMHSWARHVPVFDGTGICERNGPRVGRKAASI